MISQLLLHKTDYFCSGGGWIDQMKKISAAPTISNTEV